MNRREAIKKTFAASCTVWATGTSLSYVGCTHATGEKETFTSIEREIVEAIADVLIPDTGVPGAKAAGVGPFILMMVQDCYPEEVQKSFLSGISGIEQRSKELFKDSFLAVSKEDQGEILKDIKNDPSDALQSFYKLIRELTFLGYFTSEIGATQALEYVPVPGKYEGCVPYINGQRAWVI